MCMATERGGARRPARTSRRFTGIRRADQLDIASCEVSERDRDRRAERGQRHDPSRRGIRLGGGRRHDRLIQIAKPPGPMGWCKTATSPFVEPIQSALAARSQHRGHQAERTETDDCWTPHRLQNGSRGPPTIPQLASNLRLRQRTGVSWEGYTRMADASLLLLARRSGWRCRWWWGVRRWAGRRGRWACRRRPWRGSRRSDA